MRGVVRGSSVRFGTTSMHHKLTITLEVTCDLKKIEDFEVAMLFVWIGERDGRIVRIPNVSIFPSFRAWSLLAYNFVKRKSQRSSWIRPRTRRGDRADMLVKDAAFMTRAGAILSVTVFLIAFVVWRQSRWKRRRSLMRESAVPRLRNSGAG